MKNNIKVKSYPKNKNCAIVVTIDDLHPQGVDKGGLDFGFDNFNSNQNFFWKKILETKKVIPEIKFTIYTVANWVDKPELPSGLLSPLRRIYKYRNRFKKDTFNISDQKFSSWIDFINKLVKEQVIEIGLHGLYHHNSNKKFAPSQEVSGLDKSKLEETISEMVEIFDLSKIIYKKSFRSPGWGLNKDLTEILEKNGVFFQANSSDFTNNILQPSNVSGYKNQKITELNELTNKSYNLVANTYPNQIQRAVEIAKSNGIITIHSHISETTLGLKYVDKNYHTNLLKIVNEIQKQTAKKIWFTTVHELCNFQKNLSKLKISENENKIIFKNESEEDINEISVQINNQPFLLSLKKQSEYEFDLDKLNIFSEKYKVSCILTVFNGEKTILDSLDSICCQSYRNIEVIVVNDGSKDNTKKLVEKYIDQNRDKRIKLINQENKGRSKARNEGVKYSSGDILTFMEDDAFYSQDYILNASNHFEKLLNEEIAGIIGPHYVWNKNSSFTTRTKDLERRRNFANYKPFSTWFYSKETFKRIGGFNENLEFGEDVEPAQKLKKEGRAFVFEPNSIWLHKEPSNFFNYLKRKFKGGMGMASIEKTVKNDKVVPTKWVILLTLILIIGNTSLVFLPFIFFTLVLMIVLIALLLLRLKDIKLSKKISNENILFVCLSIYIEYVWWISTFTGYIYGKFLDNKKIISKLKGR